MHVYVVGPWRWPLAPCFFFLKKSNITASVQFVVGCNSLTHCFLCLVQVLEETGFDVSELLNKDDYIEVIFGQQRVRLYIIAGVSDDTVFAPQTKKEISVRYLPHAFLVSSKRNLNFVYALNKCTW